MNKCLNNITEQVNDTCPIKPVLPNMPMRWTCCAECPAGDYDYSREQVWCGKYRSWYNGSDGCSSGPNK